MTRPRRATNHRLATIAPNTRAIAPVPTPTKTPHNSHNCQAEVITMVSALPEPTTKSASATTLRMPNRSMMAAANGAVRP